MTIIDGLCECGCGGRAPLAQRTNRAKGHIRGVPLRFITGHNSRLKDDPVAKVDTSAGPDGCWPWTGSLNRKGYGRAQSRGVHRQAHRAVYERLVGPVDPALHLDHLCRNKVCCNPAHLEAVTPSENRARQAAALRVAS